MTKEEKTAWLQAASPEALIEQFIGVTKNIGHIFDHAFLSANEIIEDYDLTKAELLRRLSK